MKTTKKQLISEYQDGNYAAVEIYRSTDNRNELHTDYIKHECESLDELPDNYDIACEVYELDQDEYNNTILANTCQTADFKAWYGDPDAIVLVVLIDYDELPFDGTGYCDDVEDVELTKHGNGNDYLRWTWKGREYWAQGEFHVDKNGILHHDWITPTGHEIEITTQYREEPNIHYYVINIGMKRGIMGLNPTSKTYKTFAGVARFLNSHGYPINVTEDDDICLCKWNYQGRPFTISKVCKY